jgi:hypothetical protein
MCLVKMRIICNALALHDKEIPPQDHEKTAPKLTELGQILNDEVTNNGKKALVFSQWAEMLKLTEPVLQRHKLGYVKLTGSVPSGKRGALIERFFEDPDCRVFLSTDAGGLGLNLQAASLVINLDLPWNPAVLEQRIGRAHRHGQRHSVQVVNLVAKDTIEERMLDTLAAKRNVFAGVFGTEETPSAIRFEDTGQELLKQLDEFLREPVNVELELEPSAQEPLVERERPTLKGFSDLLVTRLSHRVLLVRKAPKGDGILVVVDGAPSEFRPLIESTATEHFSPEIPRIHLMEQEGYQVLTTLLESVPISSEEEIYRASALPSPIGPDGRKILEEKCRKARDGLDMAHKRLSLADVVLKGGFPEEMLAPLREALGWGLSSLVTLYGDPAPDSELPPARLVQSLLVDEGHLADDLAMRLARVRELTEPLTGGEKAPAPSTDTGGNMLQTVGDLIEVGRQKVVEMEL